MQRIQLAQVTKQVLRSPLCTRPPAPLCLRTLHVHSPISTRIPRHPFVQPRRRVWTDETLARHIKYTEDKVPLTLEITPSCAKQLAKIHTNENNTNLMLRVTVESGGCHGYQYLMSLTEDFNPEEDAMFERDGTKVVVDAISLDLITGSKVDYSTELIGSQFKIIDNPAASSNCGCGASFDLDFNKQSQNGKSVGA